MIKQILLIFLLLVICISVLLFISPFIDHIFYVHHKIDKMKQYEIYSMMIVHVLLIGIFIISIHYLIIDISFNINTFTI